MSWGIELPRKRETSRLSAEYAIGEPSIMANGAGESTPSYRRTVAGGRGAESLCDEWEGQMDDSFF